MAIRCNNPTSGSGKSFKLTLPTKQAVNHLALVKDITFGERIREFAVEGKTGGKWKMIFQGTYIAHKFIYQLDGELFAAFRLKTNASLDELQILNFKVFNFNK